MVWAEFKMLAGMVLIISFGPSSCTGKTYELCNEYREVANMEKIKGLVLHVSGENCAHYTFIRELVDSLCRDGTNTPIVCVHMINSRRLAF